jgi:CRISPR-associated protein Csb3
MTHPEPTIKVNVDVTNPGQFFACCGLLELADRLWPGAEAWFDFDNQQFCIQGGNSPGTAVSSQLIDAILNCRIGNSMTAKQVARREELIGMPTKERNAQKLDDEKKSLDKLWRESPVIFCAPFNVRIDWFIDSFSGGSTFKTWAGQQSVIDIATAMQTSLLAVEFGAIPSERWLAQTSIGGGVPFNFDAMLGGQGSDRDVGFSRDPLQISTVIRPLIELMAFVGLQRFRPAITKKRNRYCYALWNRPLSTELASAVASCSIPFGQCRNFAFSLLYRTKYLKSFLPATPIGDEA